MCVQIFKVDVCIHVYVHVHVHMYRINILCYDNMRRPSLHVHHGVTGYCWMPLFSAFASYCTLFLIPSSLPLFAYCTLVSIAFGTVILRNDFTIVLLCFSKDTAKFCSVWNMVLH